MKKEIVFIHLLLSIMQLFSISCTQTSQTLKQYCNISILLFKTVPADWIIGM